MINIPFKNFLRALSLLSYADIATLVSALLGFLAITYIIDGSDSSYLVAMLLLPVSAIIDGMDGALARKFGTKHEYGKYLDSISDSICFGLAPSILVYSLYYDLNKGPALDFLNNDFEFQFRYNIDNIIAISASFMILILSVFRLAKFTRGNQGSNTYFSGLPSPGLAMFIIVISVKFSPINDYDSVVIPILIGFVSLLTVTNISYAKARAQFKFPILFGIIFLLATIFLAYIGNSFWETLWFGAFALYMVYFAILPALISIDYFKD